MKTYYDNISKSYNQLYGEEQKKKLDIIKDCVHVKKSYKLLDVGCGTGISSDFDGGGGIVGWQDASETQNVTSALRNRGYSDTEIAKLWGGNLLRVLDQTQKIAEQLQKGEL